MLLRYYVCETSYLRVAVKQLRLELPIRTFFFCLTSLSKHFQNLKVSSAAAETTVVPSGLIAMERTLSV
eukprot:m.350291 g.350291  ORF g.350291 m.350291 type:complete len:69 (-) comp46709_c0_seq1:145-351(-)